MWLAAGRATGIDFSGLIAPGMPNVPIEPGEKFGRLMDYGDGMYARGRVKGSRAS
ncbi:MAG: hypothetical protein ACYSU0_03570 [Planctomycetota bacterium]|jgi:hypothetical protein